MNILSILLISVLIFATPPARHVHGARYVVYDERGWMLPTATYDSGGKRDTGVSDFPKTKTKFVSKGKRNESLHKSGVPIPVVTYASGGKRDTGGSDFPNTKTKFVSKGKRMIRGTVKK